MSDILAKVPEHIRRTVVHSLKKLRDYNHEVLRWRAMDERFHTGGRYEFELRQALASDLAKTMTSLEQFVLGCRRRGLDPDAVFTALGGRPAPLTPTPEVLQWQQEAQHRENCMPPFRHRGWSTVERLSAEERARLSPVTTRTKESTVTPEMLAALEQLHTSLACAQVRYAERVAAAFDGLTNLVAPYESGHPAVDVLHAVALLVDKAIMAHRAVAVRELDTLLTDLCDGRIADGIALWRHRGGFLGCLQDRQAQPISGSTPWDPLPTVADVLASLQRAAHTLRERRAEEGPKRPSADAVAEEEL